MSDWEQWELQKPLYLQSWSILGACLASLDRVGPSWGSSWSISGTLGPHRDHLLEQASWGSPWRSVKAPDRPPDHLGDLLGTIRSQLGSFEWQRIALKASCGKMPFWTPAKCVSGLTFSTIFVFFHVLPRGLGKLGGPAGRGSAHL